MEHVSEIKLLDLIAGRLDASESEQIRQHIARCPNCAKRQEYVAQTWETLGHWRIDSSAHQIADRIEALAARSQSRPNILFLFKGSAAAALRIAAAVILAVGGGHLLGRYNSGPSRQQPPAADEGPRYVAALGFEWSSGLTWAVLEEDSPGGVDQQ